MKDLSVQNVLYVQANKKNQNIIAFLFSVIKRSYCMIVSISNMDVNIDKLTPYCHEHCKEHCPIIVKQ